LSKNVPLLERFFLQPLIPALRISELLFEKRCKSIPAANQPINHSTQSTSQLNQLNQLNQPNQPVNQSTTTTNITHYIRRARGLEGGRHFLQRMLAQKEGQVFDVRIK
jgi:hypothetical protein